MLCRFDNHKLMIMLQDFEINGSREFLSIFWNSKNMFRLSPQMVDKLSKSEDPYGKYGYGQWLYRTQYDEESWKLAWDCFKFASDNGVADATYLISTMLYYGDHYDEYKMIWKMDRSLSHILHCAALEKGSELAKLQRCSDLFYGCDYIKANKQMAIDMAIRNAEQPEATLLWREKLASFYQALGETEKAIQEYEKCIEGGLEEAILDLALLYYQRGNIALYESYMEEGIAKGIPSCMMYGVEEEDIWDELSPEIQQERHEKLAARLEIGAAMGDRMCQYGLAKYKLYGMMGFEKDLAEAYDFALRGLAQHLYICWEIIDEILDAEGIEEILPKEIFPSEEEQLLLMLRTLRYGYDSLIENICDHSQEYKNMGYADEIENYWEVKLKEAEKLESQEDSCELPHPIPELTKTPTSPMVLIIYPSGFTELLAADFKELSYQQKGELIRADGLDAVHFSEPLNRLTKECNLDRQLTMYVDKNANLKNLPDNAIGTMLYGKGQEIHGAIIIATEDEKYNTHSFDTEEDIENVFNAIDALSGGLLTLDPGDEEDGKYDAWV